MVNRETMLRGDGPDVQRNSSSKILGDPGEHCRELLFLGRSVPRDIEHEFDVNPCIDGTFYKGPTVLQEAGRPSQSPICLIRESLEPDKQCIHVSRVSLGEGPVSARRL